MHYAGFLSVAAAAALLSASSAALAQDQPAKLIPAPTAADWAAIAQLPDFSGTWSPDVRDQYAQEDTNPPPWKPEVRKQVDFLIAEEKAGRPKGLFINCLPHGSPSLMAITHDALEFLVTPGRVTVLGESDGNRIRRIWTDGRPLPDDADPSFDGYSVGRWDNGALLVETNSILPQVYVAISEAVGIPNNGDMIVRERIHLLDENTMAVDMEVDAPKILDGTWSTRRLYHRRREQTHEILQGVCRQGDFLEGTDEWGNSIFEPAHLDGQGNRLPPPTE